MKTAGISETAVTVYQTARFQSLEYHSAHFWPCENLRTRVVSRYVSDESIFVVSVDNNR